MDTIDEISEYSVPPRPINRRGSTSRNVNIQSPLAARSHRYSYTTLDLDAPFPIPTRNHRYAYTTIHPNAQNPSSATTQFTYAPLHSNSPSPPPAEDQRFISISPETYTQSPPPTGDQRFISVSPETYTQSPSSARDQPSAYTSPETNIGTPTPFFTQAVTPPHSIYRDNRSSLHTRYHAWRRVSLLGTIALSLGTLIVFGIIALLAYLWFAKHNSKTWHTIVVHSWLTKLVTILSMFLRLIITLQAAFCTAMLASLILEIIGIHLPYVAKGVNMKAKPDSWDIYSLAPIFFRLPSKFVRRNLFLACLLVVLAITTALMQATSVLLISDIDTRLIPGTTNSSTRGYHRNDSIQNFDDIIEGGTSRTTWLRTPDPYPAFAEYMEPTNKIGGVDDTGLTLRAFLPYATSPEREVLRSFSGKTTVFDARVSCQAPAVQDVKITINKVSRSYVMTGYVRAMQLVPRLDNSTVLTSGDSSQAILSNDTAVEFSCAVFVNSVKGADNPVSVWKTSLCQLGGEKLDNGSTFSGSLISEFVEPHAYQYNTNAKFGAAYLVWNASNDDYPDLSIDYPNTDDQKVWSLVPNGTRENWLDLTRNATTVYWSPSSVISLSLCYAAFNTSILDINTTSNSTRSEPRKTFNSNTGVYAVDEVVKQMNSRNATPSERGILTLDQKPSWIAVEADDSTPGLSTAQDFSDLAGSPQRGFTSRTSAPLWPGADTGSWRYPPRYPDAPAFLVPHSSHTLLFQEALRQTGSLAFALQSVFTVLASLDYYDHLPSFTVTTPVIQVSYIQANIPYRHVGLIIVFSVVGTHLILCAMVTRLFIAQTCWSEIGNAWQSVAQAIGPETTAVLATASHATVDEIADMFEQQDLSGDVVVLTRAGQGRRVQMQRLSQAIVPRDGVVGFV